MRDMKDSGVAWIGNIPADWDCCKQKHALRLINGRAYSEDEFEVDGKYRILRVGNLFSNPTWYTSSLELPPDKYCENGDLLYAWSMSYAPIIWEGEKVIYHYHIWKVALSERITKKYAFYYLTSLTDAMRAEVHETTMGFLTMKAMNNSFVVLPPLNIQDSITRVLDQKCEQINALVANVQAQIEKLKAYKQSVITEVVIKGLDPTVPMKDSGVEWIGEIPEHWEITRIKNMFELRNERNNEADLSKVNLISLYTDLGVVQHSDITETTGNRAVTAEGYKFVHKDDIVVNIILCWMGAIGMSKYDGVTSPAYDIYRPLEGTNSEYYHYLFRTNRFNGECYRYGRGIMMMRWRTYSTEFRAINIPCPPASEQKQIVEYLNEKCDQIDRLIALKQSKIDKLNEYKKFLIYEYVTGKKEVS